jgi:hypothetical protein
MAKSIAFSSTILSETLRQHNHKVKHMAQASNAKMVVVKKYSGDTLRNLIRQYGIDRMRTDPKYRRDVRAALKRKREAQRAAEQRKSQRLAAKQAKASTTKP